MKKILFVTAIILLGILGCGRSVRNGGETIQDVILNNPHSFFYINFKNYPQNNPHLPIGIFDSGTGGLTVLDAILNLDDFNNKTHVKKKDGKRDFLPESFIYFGDKANMPYGEYPGDHKTKFLKELIIKDAQFLLGNKYYPSQIAAHYLTDKPPVKIIVIACNTSTAYGKSDIENLLKRGGVNLKVIGVIGAGARGALENITKDENAAIGIFATAGTVASNAYPKTIRDETKKLHYTGKIITFQQAGVGLAAAIDGEKNYLDQSLSSVRKDYRGSSLSNKIALIDKSILKRYDFDFSGNNILYKGSKKNPVVIQLNSVNNYIKYHVISLLEKIRKSGTNTKLNSIILGCTHYPYFKNDFEKVLNFAYNYKENGQYVYRNFMEKKILIVNPAINTAIELYRYLDSNNLFNNNGKLSDSRFFISVPNLSNKNIRLRDSLNFTHAYKYGRKTGEIQQYVKCVPFSKRNLSPAVLNRLKDKIPVTYQLIEEFMVKKRSIPLKVAITKFKSNKSLHTYRGWLHRFNRTIQFVNLYPLTVDSALKVLKTSDGLLCSGGGDLYPGLYGKLDQADKCGPPDRHRDSLELAAIHEAVSMKMPIIGICRGIQVINVAMGGTLYTDLPTDIGTKVIYLKKNGQHTTHEVYVKRNSELYAISRADSELVWSHHHQGIDKLGKGLKVSARSADSLAQAIEWADSTGKGFLMAVQWHPEHMDTLAPLSKTIAVKFIGEMKIFHAKKRELIAVGHK